MSTLCSERGGLAPEVELTVLAVSPFPDREREERIRELMRGALDWDALSSYAGWHRVLPVLYATLIRLDPDAIPEKARRRLGGNAEATLRSNLLIAGELSRLLRLFEERGLAAIPFKGPLLALRVYGSLALRPFTDLDLLVRPEDIIAAQQILASAGYHPSVPLSADQERAYFRYEHDRTFVSEGSRVVLELHWRFFARYVAFPLDLERLLEHPDRVRLGGVDALSMPGEELLLFLALHGAKHRWSSLGWILDIARLPDAFEAFEWDRVVRLARRTGTVRVLHLGLFLADTLWGMPMPQGVRTAVAEDREALRLADDVLSRLARLDEPKVVAAEESRFYLATRERFADRFRYYRFWTFTPNLRDRSLLPLPAWLSPLYYLVRPVRIAADLLRKRS